MLLSVKYHQIEGMCFVFVAFKVLSGVPQTAKCQFPLSDKYSITKTTVWRGNIDILWTFDSIELFSLIVASMFFNIIQGVLIIDFDGFTLKFIVIGIFFLSPVNNFFFSFLPSLMWCPSLVVLFWQFMFVYLMTLTSWGTLYHKLASTHMIYSSSCFLF